VACAPLATATSSPRGDPTPTRPADHFALRVLRPHFHHRADPPHSLGVAGLRRLRHRPRPAHPGRRPVRTRPVRTRRAALPKPRHTQPRPATASRSPRTPPMAPARRPSRSLAKASRSPTWNPLGAGGHLAALHEGDPAFLDVHPSTRPPRVRRAAFTPRSQAPAATGCTGSSSTTAASTRLPSRCRWHLSHNPGSPSRQPTTSAARSSPSDRAITIRCVVPADSPARTVVVATSPRLTRRRALDYAPRRIASPGFLGSGDCHEITTAGLEVDREPLAGAAEPASGGTWLLICAS